MNTFVSPGFCICKCQCNNHIVGYSNKIPVVLHYSYCQLQKLLSRKVWGISSINLTLEVKFRKRAVLGKKSLRNFIVEATTIPTPHNNLFHDDKKDKGHMYYTKHLHAYQIFSQNSLFIECHVLLNSRSYHSTPSLGHY